MLSRARVRVVVTVRERWRCRRSFGTVGLVAPYFDFGACAFAFGVALDDQAFWPGNVVAPHDVDEPQIHLAAVEEAESETLRHHLGDEAYESIPCTTISGNPSSTAFCLSL